MARTKQTARRRVGGPVPTKVTTEEVGSVPPPRAGETPSSTTAVEERDGQTASGGKRKRDGTMMWTGKRVVFVVGGKRGEPIEM
jgi:hypothetical protein